MKFLYFCIVNQRWGMERKGEAKIFSKPARKFFLTIAQKLPTEVRQMRGDKRFPLISKNYYDYGMRNRKAIFEIFEMMKQTQEKADNILYFARLCLPLVANRFND